MPLLTDLPVWKRLKAHHRGVKKQHLRELFAKDSQRGKKLTAKAAGIDLDYSKNLITRRTLRLLVELARECGLAERIEAMFRGERINTTEDRAVLHVALRAGKDAQF